MKENTIQERIKNLTSSDFLIYVKEDPEFRKFIKAMPDKHWSKHDISAVRLGWEACKILYLFPSLDNLKVVEECRECKGEVVIDHENITLCSSCEDGKVTRAANWEDVIWIINQRLAPGNYTSILLKCGGLLRYKSVKGE